ncbi:hypothetical protein, conserved [Plasmodium gonderi]|uniref:Uncharacterized protein n=1 Tax=Plasmodium gonderi TaxID=77519 RepID=A0A1Y1JLP2_PLAGO|nr:hypothetical protein, conserved [Plasmodium gonderi]GAW83399.1 hypothetical protein, conserved [Plasmodium gonderi]
MAKSHIEIAKQLKYNSEEIKEYFEDLYEWQNKISKEQVGKTANEKGSTRQIYHGNKNINRNGEDCQSEEANISSTQVDTLRSKNISTLQKCKEHHNALKRDCNSLESYYHAWDKLKIDDVDNNVEVSNWIRKDNADGEAKERKNDRYSEEVMNMEKNKEDLELHVNMEGRKDNSNFVVEADYEINESHNCSLNLRNEEKWLLSFGCKVYDIYFSKSEEGKINYQNKKYNKCLENYNDIINYIDFELRNNNIFLEIEKNLDNELYIDILSHNNKNIFVNTKIEELCILRTKVLINRSLTLQKLSLFYESMADCSSIILFYNYFLSEQKNCANYCMNKNTLKINIKYVIFKAYYLRGMARYKLKIYKNSLKDFKNSKEYINNLNSSYTLNIDKSIQLLQNIVTQNDIKKRARRQNEYTSTMPERYKLKPKLLNIKLIPKEYMEELKSLENKSDIINCNNGKVGKGYKDICTTVISNCIDKEKKSTHNIPEEKDSEQQEYICTMGVDVCDKICLTDKELTVAEEEKKGCKKNKCNVAEDPKGKCGNICRGERKENEREIDHTEKGNRVDNCPDNYSDTDSSITLSENTMLTDVEEITPHMINMYNRENCGKRKIKNKINFEIIWNSKEIKNNFKKQIDILKIAFLEEGIFEFNLDKDIYVDILDSLFKNNFLFLFKNIDNVEYIKKILMERQCVVNDFNCVEGKTNIDSNSTSNDKCIHARENEDTGEFLNAEACVVLIDILYILTNGGKENYVFLFIDKMERTLLLAFYNFILKYTNIFICNESCLKEKTLLLKSLLEMTF